jgi:hypothetical protein
MNHERRATAGEDRIGPSANRYAFVRHGGFRGPIGRNGEVVHVAGVWALGILQAVLLVLRIEMPPGRREIRRITLGRLMDMNPVFASWKILQIQRDGNASRDRRQCGCSDRLALERSSARLSYSLKESGR